ncbi:MAG: Holliday junction branch migration protein RuvA [Bryobacteraceae bacterium]
MIAHLRGTVLEKHPNQVILEAGGVGYDVMIPISTYSSLAETGETASLRIHTVVREDAILLFGFSSAQEKRLFERLISVSGVGPKVAITILSGLAVDDVVAAIRGGMVERLVRIPGIGKKTAERLIVELRDKLDAIGASASPVTAAPLAGALSAVDQDVVSALVNLGAQRAQAETALRKAQAAGFTGSDFEALFRKAMEHLR